MKWNTILIYLILFFSIIYTYSIDRKGKSNSKPIWETRYIPFDGKNIKLITLKSLDTSNVDQILEMINRSFYSLNPIKLKSGVESIIKKNDLIVINEKVLFFY